MTHEQREGGLDALFAEARNEGPDAALMARVLADAAAVQAEGPETLTTPSRGPWVSALLAGLGGWSAVSGITAAGVMGLAVGLYAPDTVAGFVESDSLSLGIGTNEFTPDLGDLWTEDGDG